MKKNCLIFWAPFLPKYQTATIKFANPLSSQDFKTLIENILNLIFTIALPLSVVMLIVGGILIVTATGNQSQLENGKKIILYTLIGLVIILMSKGIFSFIGYLVR